MRARLTTPPLGARHNDLGPGGMVVAAAIVALFFVEAVRAAPPARLTIDETAALEVTLTVEADAAPTFQVYRGEATPGGGQQWIVELPGAAITDGPLPARGPGVLLHAARVEGVGKHRGRVVLTFADDVDFDADTKKRSLAVRFHHVGDKSALLAAHRQRLAKLEAEKKAAADAVERERIAKIESDKKAAEAKALADKKAEQERLAKVEADKRAEQERLARIETDKKAAEAARLAKIEADKKAEQERLAKIEAEKRAEQERLAKIEAEKRAEQERLAKIEAEQRAEQERLAKIEADKRAAAAKAEQERLAKIEADKKAAEAARLAKIEADKKAAEQERLAKIEADKKAAAERAERERLAKVEADKKAAAERAERERLAKIEADKKAEQDRLAKIAEERRRLEEAAARQRLAEAAEQQRLAEARRLEEERRREQERLAKIEADKQAVLAAQQEAERRRLDEERRREQERLAKAEADKKAAAERADDAGFGGAPVKAAKTPPATTTLAKATPLPPADGGFGGGRSVEFSRGVRYERVSLPKEGGDDFGYGDDDGGDDEADIDETLGRSVLSQLTVQKTATGSRLGVLVDGGARYHVARRGRERVVLTLLDTRARNLDVRRFVDARALGGPILGVGPTVEEDRRYRIEIVLDTRGRGPVRVKQEGLVLWVEVSE